MILTHKLISFDLFHFVTAVFFLMFIKFVAILLATSGARGWDAEGHRVISRITGTLLSQKAKILIRDNCGD